MVLDGVGGLTYSGRWHKIGRPVLYTADSSALAMLEVLVHQPRTRLPDPFQILEISAPEDLEMEQWPVDHDHNNKSLTTEWGDAFLRSGRKPLARVPSVVAPESWNYVLNPLHSEAPRVKVTAAGRWPWDARLFRRS